MIRAFFTCILCLCLSFVSFSQDRVNLKPDKFDAKSAQIIYATLWRFVEPKWVSESNKNGYYSQFDYIRFAKLKSDKDDYYVLIKKFTNSAYKYPSISAGKYYFKTIKFYIYTKQSYEQIINIQQGEILVLPLIGYAQWSARWGDEYNEHASIQDIKWNIDAYENSKPTYGNDELLYIKRTKSEGQDVVRFWLPDKYFSEERFEEVYWEVSYSIFKNLFINE